MIMEERKTDKEDIDLVKLAQTGDADAQEKLMRKYKKIVKIKSHCYYMIGADEDDIIQEGMIGLLKAIRNYEADKGAQFRTFAGTCITRQIIDAIRGANRDKHKILNDSIPLEKSIKQENEEMVLSDIIQEKNMLSPEDTMIVKDAIQYINDNGEEIFSSFETEVLRYAAEGKTSKETARALGKADKSVNNAMQRIKKKIISYLNT